ncbi:MAG: hypothetical protein JXA50_11195 [Deltaproteobacteria bacterium]|nr:hypothetical protein [Deltaproteobacteria bacterium]
MTSRLKLLIDITKFCRQKKIDPQTYMRLRIERLPFKLGEGKGKIPFIIDRELAETISSSVQQLVALIKKRKEREMVSPLHSYLPSNAQKRPKDIMERYLCTRDLRARPLEKRVAEDAIYHNSYLDAGILEGWFLQHKDPTKLTRSIKRLYEKAIEEEIKHGDLVDIAYLTHLCLVTYFRKAKKSLKGVNIRGFSYEKLEQAVGQILYSLVQTIQASIFDEIRYKDLTLDISRIEHLIRGTTTPLTFVSIRPTLFKNDLNPYHLDQEGFELLQSLTSKIDLNFNNIEESLKSLVNHAKKNRRVREKLLEVRSINKIREVIFDYLKDYEDYSGGKNLWLFNLFQKNKVMQSALANDEVDRKFEEDLSKIISDTSRFGDKEQAQRAMGIEKVYKSQKQGGTMKRLFFSTREEEQLKEVIEGFLLYQCDEIVDKRFSESLQYLDDREVLKKRDVLEDEYDKGRMYLLTTDTRPIIQDLSIKKEGHLFMDLRGFTQMMCRSKEISMADFMLKDFFLPILEVAKKYYTDAGVRLNNLVGDALSFSGRLRPLVSLAQEAREIFLRYTDHIKEREGLFGEGDETRAIGARYQQERKAILQERKDIEESIVGIERELKLKEFLNPTHLIKVQEEEFETKVSHYQQQIINLPYQIEREEDLAERDNLMKLHENVSNLKADIYEQKTELMETINSIGQDDLNNIYRLVCAEERDELERLRRLLKASYDKESELNRAYEMEIASGGNAVIEYGLFISYGDAAETIAFEDPFWGKMNVAIAEKLNEAARGTGRNPDIRKKMDLLLRNARRAKGNPALAYPFYVFIDRGYGLFLRSDMRTMIENALQNRDKEAAEAVMKIASSLFMNDIDKGMKGAGDDGWETLTYSNDIYNLGEAMSGEALQIYLKEIGPHKYTFDKTITINALNREIQQRFFFPSPELKFTVSVEKEGDQLQFDLFRYVGDLVFRGFEIHNATAVYEIVRKNSPLYLLLERHHLEEWYREAKEKNRGIKTALG